jgi:hypothetical protein
MASGSLIRGNAAEHYKKALIAGAAAQHVHDPGAFLRHPVS